MGKYKYPKSRWGAPTFSELEDKMRNLLQDAKVNDEVLVLVPTPLGYSLYQLDGERAEVAKVACGIPPNFKRQSVFIPWGD